MLAKRLVFSCLTFVQPGSAVAQMGFRQERYYEEGGFSDPATGLFSIVFAFLFWGVIVWLLIRQLDDKSPRRTSADYEDHRRPHGRSNESSGSYEKRRPLKVISTSRSGVYKSESLSFVTLYPYMIYPALERASQDPSAAFFLIGRSEKPVIAWFACGKAADLSLLPIRIDDLHAIFGYHKDILGGGEDEVSYEVFSVNVRKIHG